MSGTYHIWPLTTGLIFFYLMGLAGLRLGIFSKSAHRRFWNVLLLLIFLITASLGLFFAFQVNYKINFTAEDRWMLIHVDAGIGLAITALIHFSWHLRYYLDLFKNPAKKRRLNSKVEPDVTEEMASFPGGKTLRIPLYLLGFTTLISQVLILRSFLNLFDGNELVIGIILGNWMILTGFGAWLGRKAYRMRRKRQFVTANMFWLGILPILTTVLLFVLRNVVFIHGSMAGFVATFLYSLVLLFPLCVLSGYSFSLYAYILSTKEGRNLTGKAYAWEAIGSVAGGVLFSFVLVFFLTSLQILSLVLLANVSGVFLWMKDEKRRVLRMVFFSVAILVVLTVFLFPADRFIQHFLYPNQKITFMRETPLGNLVVTQNGDQVNLFENGVPVASTLDPITKEEDVHYAMLQRPSPGNVLLISGGITGMIGEILKYPVVSIDYIEYNPWLIRIGKTINKEMDLPKINIIKGDVRRYIRRDKRDYDVVLMHLPPPSTAMINRYYTRDFYLEISTHLTSGGVICFGLPASPNYLGRESLEMISLMVHTLRSVWPYVEIVPGEKYYFLASDQPLSLEIARLAIQRNIHNDYVSPDYIMDDLLVARSQQIMNQIEPVRKLNTDMNPVAYFKQISVWLSYYGFDKKIVAGAIGIIFLLLLIRLNRISIGVFAGGFTASAAEMLLLFIFQVQVGHLYLMISLFITLFMTGLALGALSRRDDKQRKTHKMFVLSLGLMGLLVVLSPLYLRYASLLHHVDLISRLILFLHMFFIAFLAGRMFLLGSLLQKGGVVKIASSLYSADLAGGAMGALLVSGFLLPLLGITGTAMLTGAFCFLIALILLYGKRE